MITYSGPEVPPTPDYIPALRFHHPPDYTPWPSEIPIPNQPNSPTHIEIPESCLPLRKRVRFASPTPSHEVGESSAVGAARQDRHAIARDDPYSIAREDLYGFVDMVDVPPRCSMSRELDYDITDTMVQLTKTLRLLKGLQTQMVEFQRQHGPAEGPSQPDAP
ncbi:hypothetical protein Tco_0661007 [Tanacetum coccineum]